MIILRLGLGTTWNSWSGFEWNFTLCSVTESFSGSEIHTQTQRHRHGPHPHSAINFESKLLLWLLWLLLLLLCNQTKPNPNPRSISISMPSNLQPISNKNSLMRNRSFSLWPRLRSSKGVRWISLFTDPFRPVNSRRGEVSLMIRCPTVRNNTSRFHGLSLQRARGLLFNKGQIQWI